jgi:hypothetical protein
MRQNDERHDNQRDQRDTSQPRQPAGEGYGGGTPGMSGVAGNIAGTDEIQQTAPAGVPTAPGTGQNPGAVMNSGAAGTPSTPKMSNILGTPGGVGQTHAHGNIEGGTPGVPGTPTPAPIGGQLENREIPGAAGPTTPSTEQLGLGGTPTPGPSGGNPDEADEPHYGTSSTQGLGGARPTGNGDDADTPSGTLLSSGGIDSGEAVGGDDRQELPPSPQRRAMDAASPGMGGDDPAHRPTRPPIPQAASDRETYASTGAESNAGIPPDQLYGANDLAAASHTPRSGDEAATLAREGQAEDAADAPPPPKTPDPWGGTVSESKANP